MYAGTPVLRNLNVSHDFVPAGQDMSEQENMKPGTRPTSLLSPVILALVSSQLPGFLASEFPRIFFPGFLLKGFPQSRSERSTSHDARRLVCELSRMCSPLRSRQD